MQNSQPLSGAFREDAGFCGREKIADFQISPDFPVNRYAGDD
jgi:hypothetical protein